MSTNRKLDPSIPTATNQYVHTPSTSSTTLEYQLRHFRPLETANGQQQYSVEEAPIWHAAAILDSIVYTITTRHPTELIDAGILPQHISALAYLFIDIIMTKSTLDVHPNFRRSYTQSWLDFTNSSEFKNCVIPQCLLPILRMFKPRSHRMGSSHMTIHKIFDNSLKLGMSGIPSYNAISQIPYASRFLWRELHFLQGYFRTAPVRGFTEELRPFAAGISPFTNQVGAAISDDAGGHRINLIAIDRAVNEHAGNTNVTEDAIDADVFANANLPSYSRHTDTICRLFHAEVVNVLTLVHGHPRPANIDQNADGTRNATFAFYTPNQVLTNFTGKKYMPPNITRNNRIIAQKLKSLTAPISLKEFDQKISYTITGTHARSNHAWDSHQIQFFRRRRFSRNYNGVEAAFPIDTPEFVNTIKKLLRESAHISDQSGYNRESFVDFLAQIDAPKGYVLIFEMADNFASPAQVASDAIIAHLFLFFSNLNATVRQWINTDENKPAWQPAANANVNVIAAHNLAIETYHEMIEYRSLFNGIDCRTVNLADDDPNYYRATINDNVDPSTVLKKLLKLARPPANVVRVIADLNIDTLTLLRNIISQCLLFPSNCIYALNLAHLCSFPAAITITQEIEAYDEQNCHANRHTADTLARCMWHANNMSYLVNKRFRVAPCFSRDVETDDPATVYNHVLSQGIAPERSPLLDMFKGTRPFPKYDSPNYPTIHSVVCSMTAPCFHRNIGPAKASDVPIYNSKGYRPKSALCWLYPATRFYDFAADIFLEEFKFTGLNKS